MDGLPLPVCSGSFTPFFTPLVPVKRDVKITVKKDVK
jgi:hypothetical protein